MSSLKKICQITEKLSGILDTDIGKISITGWKPKFDISEGLEKTFKVMKSYYEV